MELVQGVLLLALEVCNQDDLEVDHEVPNLQEDLEPSAVVNFEDVLEDH